VSTGTNWRGRRSKAATAAMPTNAAINEIRAKVITVFNVAPTPLVPGPDSQAR
jgi:hypothetical protein